MESRSLVVLCVFSSWESRICPSCNMGHDQTRPVLQAIQAPNSKSNAGIKQKKVATFSYGKSRNKKTQTQKNSQTNQTQKISTGKNP
jgi:hypothetical protein